MKKIATPVFTALLFLICSCVTLVKVQSTSPNAADPSDHLGEMLVPDYKQTDFSKAATLVIQIINSDAFAQRVSDSVRILSAAGKPYSAAWAGWTADRIVTGMRSKIRGLKITTYGGPFNLIKRPFTHNLAYDGEGADPNANTPIRISRILLSQRTVAELCNTIAHETAHKVGLSHPHSSTVFKIAEREPPYAIGNLVEALAAGN